MRVYGCALYSVLRRNILRYGLPLGALAALIAGSWTLNAVASGAGTTNANPPLVSVSFVGGSSGIIQGDSVNAYISVVSDFTSASGLSTVLTAQLDGTQTVSLLHPSPDLWVAPLGAFLLIQSHTLTVSTYVQNAAQTQTVQNSISQLNQQIDTLNDQIANEKNPAELSTLQAQLMQDQTQLQALQTQLQGLSQLVGQDSFKFNVAPNNTQGNTFPHISSVSPAVGPTTGGTLVTLTGTNFTSDAQVVMGGQKVGSVTFVNSTQLTFTVSPLSAGAKDIEILEGSGASQQNTFLHDGFVVVPTSASFTPVAFVANPSAPAVVASTVTLDGSGSYAPTGRPLTYIWHFVSVPPGSKNVDTNFPATAKTTFSPDTAGTYVIQLTVSDGLSTSEPSLAVLTVFTAGAIQLAPANQIGFAARIGQTITTPVTITNTSTLESVQVTSANITGASLPITVGLPSGTTLPITVGPGSSVTLQLSYTPTTVASSTTGLFQVTGTGLVTNSALSVNVPLTAVSFEAFPITLEQVFNTAPSYTNTLHNNGVIDLFAIYDSEIDTTINVVNTSDQPITLTAPPTLTPTGGQDLMTVSIGTTFPITIQGNSSAPLTLKEVPTPANQLARTEGYVSYNFSWDFGLLPGTGVDKPLNLALNVRRLTDIGVPNLGNQPALSWGNVPEMASPTPVLWPGGSYSTISFFPSYSGCCSNLWIPTFQWMHQVTNFHITGTNAAQFTAFFHTGGSPEPAVPATFDFGNADVAPPQPYQQFAQIDYYFTPIANQTGTYTATLQIQMAGMSTPISIPLTATVTASSPAVPKPNKELP